MNKSIRSPIGKKEIERVISNIGKEITEKAKDITKQIDIMSTQKIIVNFIIQVDSIPEWQIIYSGLNTNCGVIWKDRVGITEEENDNSDNSRSNTDNDKQHNDNVNDSEHNE